MTVRPPFLSEQIHIASEFEFAAKECEEKAIDYEARAKRMRFEAEKYRKTAQYIRKFVGEHGECRTQETRE